VNSPVVTPLIPRHFQLCVPPCALARMSRRMSSPLETVVLRGSENPISVNLVAPPKSHPCSRTVLAFLSESSNRVIITGRNLRHESDSMVSEAKRYPDLHDVSTIARRKIW